MQEELQVIADLCIKHDVICISDEVYEWLTYDGTKHVKIGKSRTVRIMQYISCVDFLRRITFFFFWQPVCQVCGNALSPLGVLARLSVPQGGRWAGQIQQGFFFCNINCLYLSFCLWLAGSASAAGYFRWSLFLVITLLCFNVGGLGNGIRAYPEALKNRPSELSVSLCHSCPGKTMLLCFKYKVCVIFSGLTLSIIVS